MTARSGRRAFRAFVIVQHLSPDFKSELPRQRSRRARPRLRRASRFLRPRDGRQALDLVDLVDSNLEMVLVGALEQAPAAPSPLAFNGVRLDAGGEEGVHKVTVRRLPGRGGTPPHLLVSLDPAGGPARPWASTNTWSSRSRPSNG